MYGVDKTVVESVVVAVVSGAAKVGHVTSGQDMAVVVASGQTGHSISGQSVVDVIVSGVVVVVVVVVEAGVLLVTAVGSVVAYGSRGLAWKLAPLGVQKVWLTAN